jgi:(2Fe-2S) ferredoxin
MPFPLFESIARQALDLGWRTICLSGGEPFLFPEYIAFLSKLCAEREAELVVQTNGFWGKRPAQAHRTLEQLKPITRLGFSVDKVHLRRVGLDPVIQAIATAMAVDRKTAVSISISYQTYREFEGLKGIFKHSFPGIEIIGWPILPIGRARQHPELRVDHLDCTWDCLQRSCGVQGDFSPVVHPNGDLHACYRPIMALESADPLRLGNLGEARLEELLGHVENPILLYMMAFGAGGLGYLVQNTPYQSHLEDRYQGVCHFCYEVLSRSEVVNYLRMLLEQDVLAESVQDRLSIANDGKDATQPSTKERIIVCNGKQCGRRERNYPLIHFLINRLVDTNKAHLASVETVHCLNSCRTAPNMFIEKQNRLLQHVQLDTVRELVDNLIVNNETSPVLDQPSTSSGEGVHSSLRESHVG